MKRYLERKRLIVDSHQVPNTRLKLSQPVVLKEFPEAEFDRLMNLCEQCPGQSKELLSQAWELLEELNFPTTLQNRYHETMKKTCKKKKRSA